MFKLGFFRFIGVVKTAHRGYPLQCLGSLQLAEQGSMAAIVSEHDDVYLTAFVNNVISSLLLTELNLVSRTSASG